ncbi:MAG TPA: FapA family protein [Fibrobacteraceae bacterium]|nr:FapA family protein [Fibrobacteraceae bacterium]
MSSKNLVIDAASIGEAINLGSVSLGVSRNAIAVTSTQQLTNGQYRVHLERAGSSDELERMLSMTETQLLDIESSEIVKGMTGLDMDAKGLLQVEPDVETDTEEHGERQVGVFVFLAQADFLVCDVLLLQDTEWLSHVETKSEIIPGVKVVRVHGITPQEIRAKHVHPDSGPWLMEAEGKNVFFSPEVPGKILLVRDQLYLLPSNRSGEMVLQPITNPMKAFCDLLPPAGQGSALVLRDAQLQLQTAKIIFGVRIGELEQALTRCASTRQPVRDLCVARGLLPLDGSDAKIDVFFSLESGAEEFTVLPDGRVDYHRKVKIPSAHAGDMLARISLPSVGQSGMDVFGNFVDARPGNPKPLCPGEGVRASPDGREFFATRDGQICYNQDILSVMPVFQLIGDVDQHSGNIEFNGNVTITGSITSGFSVKATGDISVRGNVESANVEAGRDLIVRGGIVGAGMNPIRVGRNLVVHHLQNAWVEAEGDVFVNHSCLHSRVDTSGLFQCFQDKGALIGGSVTSMKGATVHSVGSNVGTQTKLVVGQDFLVRKKLEESQKALSFVHANLQKLENYLTPMLAKLGPNLAALDPEQKVRLKRIVDHRNELANQQTLLNTRILRLERSSNMLSGVKVVVTGTLYPFARLQICGVPWSSDTELQQMQITLDSAHKKIQAVSIHHDGRE